MYHAVLHLNTMYSLGETDLKKNVDIMFVDCKISVKLF